MRKYRIEIFNTEGCRLGYLRQVGNELSLKLPTKGKYIDNHSPPLLLDTTMEAEEKIKQYIEERQKRQNKFREINFCLVEINV